MKPRRAAIRDIQRAYCLAVRICSPEYCADCLYHTNNLDSFSDTLLTGAETRLKIPPLPIEFKVDEIAHILCREESISGGCERPCSECPYSNENREELIRKITDDCT